MAQDRKSAAMIQQIHTLRAQGLSIRALGVHRKTVRKYLPEEDPRHRGPEEGARDAQGQALEVLPWEAIHREATKGVTLKQLHAEYAPGLPYLKFWRFYRNHHPQAPEVTMVLHHKPGERVFVDFCDGLVLYDRKTGKVKAKTQLFCGVMAFSSYTFAEFVSDQKLPTFLGVQERMWGYFGGVTPYVVVDNLKSGVTKAHRYDPDVNPSYCEFTNHMGCAVLPARPRAPRDKAAVETAIGVIQKTFYQEVRNHKFYSLTEVNEALRMFLKRLNAAVMKDYGISRQDRFDKERGLLKPLPQNPFEISEWRKAKVHPDCHIQVYKNFYSVPFTHVGQVVRVRLSRQMLEAFDGEGQCLAAHRRLKGQHNFSTSDSHYPEAKVSLARFDIQRAKRQAQDIGPNILTLVEKLLNQSHPLRYLRRIQGVLSLPASHGLTPEALEHAAKMALAFNKPRLAYIRDCALFFMKNGNRPVSAPPKRDEKTMHLHQSKSHEPLM